MRNPQYYLDRASLHQRLSALRYKHAQEVIRRYAGYGKAQLSEPASERVKHLQQGAEMHAEIARDYRDIGVHLVALKAAGWTR